MENDREKIRIFNTEAKVYLDYEMWFLREIIDSIRNETGSITAPMLREYESKLIEAERLATIRETERQRLINEQKEYRDE